MTSVMPISISHINSESSQKRGLFFLIDTYWVSVILLLALPFSKMLLELTFQTFYVKIHRLSHSDLIGDPSYKGRFNTLKSEHLKRRFKV